MTAQRSRRIFKIMGNEQDLLQKRYMDLSRQADRKGIVIYSGFLNLNEQNVLESVKSSLDTSVQLFGGFDYAERKIAAFIPRDLGYEWEYPIQCLKIMPSHPKFADALTHRDVLGAVMNLGLERSKIGDILCKEDTYYLFCHEQIQEYLHENLCKIKHTAIHIEDVDTFAETIVPDFIEKSGIITSNRLDSVVACFCGCSRSEASRLIAAGKVFVMGKEILHNTYNCKEGDILSIRSYGKYIFDNCAGETKKGRQKIKYRIYN